MRKTIFKQRFFVSFFICLGVFVLTLLGCLLLLLRIENQGIQATKNYNDLYVIADEFRQTSDDLTTMVRLYVLTGNKKYVEYYDEILSIREGLSPRPEDYNEVYWDLVLAEAKQHITYGTSISFRKQIEQVLMSAEEKKLLEASESSSQKLCEQEEEAINAIQGKFKDSSGVYSVEAEPNFDLARKLVSNRDYLRGKVEVMRPLQAFYKKIDEEMDSINNRLATFNRRVIFISIALLLSIAFGMGFFLHKALKSLARATQSNENLLLSALPPAISERIRQKDESSVKECEACVLFLDIGIESNPSGQESEVLQSLYSELDQLVESYKVERIRTLQGNYMVASGISDSTDHAAENLASFALAARDKVSDWGRKYDLDLFIRIGMASGTVIAGILDDKKYIYDLWGDVLKVASRLESKGIKGQILITRKMAQQIKHLFLVEEMEGDEKIYFLRKNKKD